MKTKRSRKDYSEDDSDEPEQHWAASKRKSDSDLFASSDEGPKKSKKRRKKRDTSSESESEDTDKESHKKRKHKKKKRKHSKKKRKDVSSEDSDSDSEDGSSDATEEDSPVIVKKRHKHRHRHSGKHSKKRRQESDDAYAEKVSVSSEREVPVKVAPSHKMRSVCMSGREQRRPTSVEKISSEEEPPRNRIERREHPRNIVYGRDDNREIAENSRNKHPPSRNPPVQYLKKGEEQAAYYPARAEAGGSRPPPRFPDHPRHPEQGREQRPRDGRERNEREDRPREEREYQNKYQDNSYNRYGDGNKNYERNGANKFQKDKYEEPRNNERYAGQSNQNYRDNRPPGGERYDERPQGYNNRRGSNSYSQNYPRDNQRQDESYEKNNDYHNNRNEQRGNRFQERNDYSAGNTSRRYESRDVNERTNPVKRERSSSPNRDVKQERRPDSRRVSKERSSRNDFKREEREESGTRTRERFPRHRASPAATDEGTYEWGRKGADGDKPKPAADKDKPNFGLSGKLTEDTNTVNGVVLKYSEPPEARQPKRKWRFYPFKGDKALPILYIHRQSCFLLGRDRKVSDIPLDHPSVSKQHAALQYRLVPFTREDGSRGKRVRPYIIDLGSANGTFVNNNKVDPSKFVELLERDVVKFGFSQREYVLLHENSKDDAMDDDDVRLGHSDDGKGRVKDEHSN